MAAQQCAGEYCDVAGTGGKRTKRVALGRISSLQLVYLVGNGVVKETVAHVPADEVDRCEASNLLPVCLPEGAVEWAASLAWVLFVAVFFAVGSPSFLFALVQSLIFTVVTVFLLRRLGLLWLVVGILFGDFLSNVPLTIQGSAWYAGISLTGILLMAALTFYGFYTLLGGRPVFGGTALEE